MPAVLTVVIPTLNAADALADTSQALLSGVTDGVIAGLVISDGGSEDATLLIAKELGGVIVTGPAGRGGQIRAGVAAANTDWVLILHADTHLSPDWTVAVLRHIGQSPDKAGYFRLRFRASGIFPRLVETGANARARLFGLPYGDQGLLISMRLLEDVGGVPDQPLMEDVALARRLKGRLSELGATAHTSAERYETGGWIRRPLRNLWTLTRYLAGASPDALARSYKR